MIDYAVVGTSPITEEFIKGANLVEGLRLAAVYSRSRDRGEAFAERFGAKRVFTDLEELADSDIDAVYIASPNSLHFEQSKLFLSKGKHVLCEKPAVLFPEQIDLLQSLAKERNLICLEAMMSMYTPARKALENALKKIGKITAARFDFSQLSSRYDLLKSGTIANVFNPEMGGGALMDLGCYCICPAVFLFGLPERVLASAGFLFSGADAYGTAVLDYDSMQVTCTYSKVAQDRLGSQIIGDEGGITIGSISKLNDITLFNRAGESNVISGEESKTELMANEARTFLNYIMYPENFKDEYGHARNVSRDVAFLLDRIAKSSGINFE
jgi:predicted dehydrogenase